MKKDYILDYISCIAFRVLGPIIRFLPLWLSLFLGKSVGFCLYCLDQRHRALAYSNIKRALRGQLPPRQISRITKKFYLNLGQNLIEVFLIPVVKKKYFKRYITVEGREHIQEAFKPGKGVIFVAMHAGNWELSNIVCANLGFAFSLFVRDQKFIRLNRLLNSLRQSQGYKIIQRENQLRGLLEALKNNEAVGMTVDQGGKSGEVVKFFGHDSSMATGAVKLALKYGAVILPAYYTRVNGPYQKVIIAEPFKIKPSFGLRGNLEELVHVFEGLISRYPYEYYWLYKIWKYGREKDILILSDGKAGHLRQSQAVAGIIGDILKGKGMRADITTLQPEFKNGLSRRLMSISGMLSGKYSCQGCLWCLKNFLNRESYNMLIKADPDLVISSGASLSAVNYVISRQARAKSVVLMRPSFLGVKKFSLVIMPRHDHPPKRKNIVVTEGALNLIDNEYLKKEAEKLIRLSAVNFQPSAYYIGLLIGGDTGNFHLRKDDVKQAAEQVKSACEKNNADVLATTSRRTSPEIEGLLKSEFRDHPRCKFLVIASENNPPYAVGGILGLSQVIIASPESISMISEAVKSKKYVIVFKTPGLGRKHLDFLRHLDEGKYIYFVEPAELSETISRLIHNRPALKDLPDDELVSVALKKII